MSLLLTPTLLLLLISFFLTTCILPLLVLLVRRRKTSPILPLPPGPRGFPFLGNIADLPEPGMMECQHWLKHKDLYGLISSLTVLGNTFVVVHDVRIAVELLRERAVVNSGRPEFVYSGSMIGWNNALAFLQTDDKNFKLQRRNIAKVASSNAALTVFNRVQEEESAHFLLNVLDSPENLFDHIRMEAGAVILKITYGYTPEKSGRDPLVDLVGRTMVDFTEDGVPGKHLVDIMPFCKLTCHG